MSLSGLLGLDPPTPTLPSLDSIWQLLGNPAVNTLMVILFGLVTVLVAVMALIISYRQGQPRKELSWQVRSDSLVVPNQEVKDRIEIRLDGKPIQDLSLVVIQVWNSGNVAIELQDYVHPITLKFEGRTVQDAYISNMEPPTLITKEEIAKFRKENEMLRQQEPMLIKLPKLHFNSRKASRVVNSFTVNVLLTGSQEPISLASGMIKEGNIKELSPLVSMLVEGEFKEV